MDNKAVRKFFDPTPEAVPFKRDGVQPNPCPSLAR